VPLSMCNWRGSVDDARERHRTTSQTESPSTPEAIGDQLRSGGSLRALSLFGDSGRAKLRLVSDGVYTSGQAPHADMQAALTSER
jgi:hypothetical protein